MTDDDRKLADDHDDSDFVGLTRFHQITIGAGILFSLMMVFHFSLDYRRGGGGVAIAFAVFCFLVAVALTVYLIRFRRHGI